MSHLTTVNAESLEFIPIKGLKNHKVSTCRKQTTFQLCAALHFGQKATFLFFLFLPLFFLTFSLLSPSFLIVGLN